MWSFYHSIQQRTLSQIVWRSLIPCRSLFAQLLEPLITTVIMLMRHILVNINASTAYTVRSNRILHRYFADDIPFFCGGDMDYLQRTASCWRYSASNDSWLEYINAIGEKRAYSGYGSSVRWGLVMAGTGHYLNNF